MPMVRCSLKHVLALFLLTLGIALRNVVVNYNRSIFSKEFKKDVSALWGGSFDRSERDEFRKETVGNTNYYEEDGENENGDEDKDQDLRFNRNDRKPVTIKDLKKLDSYQRKSKALNDEFFSNVERKIDGMRDSVNKQNDFIEVLQRQLDLAPAEKINGIVINKSASDNSGDSTGKWRKRMDKKASLIHHLSTLKSRMHALRSKKERERSDIDDVESIVEAEPQPYDDHSLDFPMTPTDIEEDIYDYPGANLEEPQDCSVKMAKVGTFSSIPLLSFPGSGSNYLRLLIEKATGYYTGSAYHDWGIIKDERKVNNYLGEKEHPLDGTTLTQKTHKVHANIFSEKLFKEADYCVFLFRDPRKAMIREFDSIHTKSQTANNLSEEEIHENDRIFKYHYWLGNATRWTDAAYYDTYARARRHYCKKGIHLVFYEDFKKDRKSRNEVLKDLIIFLNKANGYRHSIKFRKRCMKRMEDKYATKFRSEYDLGQAFGPALTTKLLDAIVQLNITFEGVIPQGYGTTDNPL